MIALTPASLHEKGDAGSGVGDGGRGGAGPILLLTSLVARALVLLSPSRMTTLDTEFVIKTVIALSIVKGPDLYVDILILVCATQGSVADSAPGQAVGLERALLVVSVQLVWARLPLELLEQACLCYRVAPLGLARV